MQQPADCSEPPIVGRYAPSPTGELHLGNARTALVAWLAARSAMGRFVLRVEDLDPPRVVPGAQDRIVRDLEWLGLDWDEGPDLGGPHAPYRQSERTAVYAAAVRELALQGRLFACTCTRKELRGLLSAPHGPGGDGPPYPGTCRDKGIAADVGGTVEAPPAALRFRVEPDKPIEFRDAVLGDQRQDVAAEVGDFVVRRSDGLYTYQLAVTVDDAMMGISSVVRGADLLASTGRQIALQQALGYPRPSYGHVPLVLGPTGERLAKRRRPATVAVLRERGVTPETLVGVLAHSLGIIPSPEPVHAHDLVAHFDWRSIGREPWVAPAWMV